MKIEHNKTILAVSTIVLSLLLVIPMVSQNVSAVSAITPTTNSNQKMQMAVTPQENDPQIAANGKLAMQLSGEIDTIKAKLKTADSSTQVQLNNQLTELEKQLEIVKIKMRDLGVPTTEEFNKDPQYWISKAKGVNMTPKTTSGVSPSCTCPYMQFQEAYAYPCYGGFTCDAYYPAWSALHVGEHDTQILGVTSDYSWAHPFWLVSISGNNVGTNSWQHAAYNPYGVIIPGTSTVGEETVTIPWYSSTWTHSSEPTVYNIRANSSFDAYWYVNHIP